MATRRKAPGTDDPEIRGELRVTFRLASPAQIALLLYTIREGGGDLEHFVEVETNKGKVNGKVALDAWEKKWKKLSLGNNNITESGK